MSSKSLPTLSTLTLSDEADTARSSGICPLLTLPAEILIKIVELDNENSEVVYTVGAWKDVKLKLRHDSERKMVVISSRISGLRGVNRFLRDQALAAESRRSNIVLDLSRSKSSHGWHTIFVEGVIPAGWSFLRYKIARLSADFALPLPSGEPLNPSISDNHKVLESLDGITLEQVRNFSIIWCMRYFPALREILMTNTRFAFSSAKSELATQTTLAGLREGSHAHNLAVLRFAEREFVLRTHGDMSYDQLPANMTVRFSTAEIPNYLWPRERRIFRLNDDNAHFDFEVSKQGARFLGTRWLPNDIWQYWPDNQLAAESLAKQLNTMYHV